MMLRCAVLAWALAAAACVSDRRFAPRENLNGEGPTGWPAAVYPLGAPLGGEVRLWSDGAGQTEVDGRVQTQIHLGFELENTGAVPLALEVAALRLELAAEAAPSAAVVPLAPRLTSGSPEAAPGTTARCDFLFEVGSDRAPAAIEAFTVRWVVRGGELAVAQATPFRPFVPLRPVPGWDEPWPYHWHVGFRYCR